MWRASRRQRNDTERCQWRNQPLSGYLASKIAWQLLVSEGGEFKVLLARPRYHL